MVDGPDDTATVHPKNALVGGGYIATELGQFFETFGRDVTIVGGRQNLLPDADPEVAEAFTERDADRFTVHAGHGATSCGQARTRASGRSSTTTR